MAIREHIKDRSLRSLHMRGRANDTGLCYETTAKVPESITCSAEVSWDKIYKHISSFVVDDIAAYCSNLDILHNVDLNITDIGLGRQDLVLDTEYASPEKIFYCSSLGKLWKSTNSGKTWTICSNPPENIGNIAVVDKNTVYAVSEYKSRIYKTTDGGGSWTQLNNTSNFIGIHDIAVHVSATGDITLYTLIGEVHPYGNGGICKSTDGGETWDLYSLTSDMFKPTGAFLIQAINGRLSIVGDFLYVLYNCSNIDDDYGFTGLIKFDLAIDPVEFCDECDEGYIDGNVCPTCSGNYRTGTGELIDIPYVNSAEPGTWQKHVSKNKMFIDFDVSPVNKSLIYIAESTAMRPGGTNENIFWKGTWNDDDEEWEWNILSPSDDRLWLSLESIDNEYFATEYSNDSFNLWKIVDDEFNLVSKNPNIHIKFFDIAPHTFKTTNAIISGFVPTSLSLQLTNAGKLSANLNYYYGGNSKRLSSNYVALSNYITSLSIGNFSLTNNAGQLSSKFAYISTKNGTSTTTTVSAAPINLPITTINGFAINTYMSSDSNHINRQFLSAALSVNGSAVGSVQTAEISTDVRNFNLSTISIDDDHHYLSAKFDVNGNKISSNSVQLSGGGGIIKPEYDVDVHYDTEGSQIGTTRAYTHELDLARFPEQYYKVSSTNYYNGIHYINFPSATTDKAGNIALYIEERPSLSTSELSGVYFDISEGAYVSAYPTRKPWLTSTTDGIWKFEFESVPGSNVWYYVKSTKYAAVPWGS